MRRRKTTTRQPKRTIKRERTMRRESARGTTPKNKTKRKRKNSMATGRGPHEMIYLSMVCCDGTSQISPTSLYFHKQSSYSLIQLTSSFFFLFPSVGHV
jgi:hypothetical protein